MLAIFRLLSSENTLLYYSNEIKNNRWGLGQLSMNGITFFSLHTLFLMKDLTEKTCTVPLGAVWGG